MTRDEVSAAVQEIMREQFRAPDLTLSETMTAGEVPGWDSLSHINFIFAVEQKFGIRISTREVRAMKNVGALIDIVLAKNA